MYFKKANYGQLPLVSKSQHQLGNSGDNNLESPTNQTLLVNTNIA